MKALLIHPDNTLTVAELAGYDGLVAAVGGQLELLTINRQAWAYLNEDGKELRLPHNRLATDLCWFWQVGLHEDDYIAGVLVVVGCNDDEDVDIPEWLLLEARNFASGWHGDTT